MHIISRPAPYCVCMCVFIVLGRRGNPHGRRGAIPLTSFTKISTIRLSSNHDGTRHVDAVICTTDEVHTFDPSTVWAYPLYLSSAYRVPGAPWRT